MFESTLSGFPKMLNYSFKRHSGQPKCQRSQINKLNNLQHYTEQQQELKALNWKSFMAMTFVKSAFMDLIKWNNTFHWFLATSCLEPSVCRYRFIQSVCPSTLYVCVCVLFMSSCFTLFSVCISPQ